MACMYPAPNNSPEMLYPYVLKQLESIILKEEDWVANASNAAATLGFLIPQLNWAGFYLYREGKLKLGPFWGKPAVVNIDMGKGVCGSSAQTRKTIVVEDVHQFPGHIACDLHSNSEIVIPLIKNGQLIGVLDIDSPEIGRFKAEDKEWLEKIALWLTENIEF